MSNLSTYKTFNLDLSSNISCKRIKTIDMNFTPFPI